MKLTAVNNRQTRQNNINNVQNNKKGISFKGFADTATTFWNFVDMFGRAGQFTVEDMCGTNFPRTIKGAMAGYEYTGKINWASVKQEGLREFLTGPTMSVMPYVILAVATKMTGKSAATHCENITNLSYLATQLGKESMSAQDFSDSFIKKVVDDFLSSSADSLKGMAKEKRNKELVDKIQEYIKIKSSVNHAASKTDKKAAKERAKIALEEMEKLFERILKEGNESYKGLNFQTVKYSVGKNAQGQTNFKNYIKYISAYIEDYIKTNTEEISDESGVAKKVVKLSKKAIESFETTWLGRRTILVASMIVVTGIVMSIIPKIYTLVSGGVNPNAVNIYNEAEKREGK